MQHGLVVRSEYFRNCWSGFFTLFRTLTLTVLKVYTEWCEPFYCICENSLLIKEIKGKCTRLILAARKDIVIYLITLYNHIVQKNISECTKHQILRWYNRKPHQVSLLSEQKEQISEATVGKFTQTGEFKNIKKCLVFYPVSNCPVWVSFGCKQKSPISLSISAKDGQ